MAWENQSKNFARVLCFQKRDFAAKLRMRRKMRQRGRRARRQPRKQGSKEASEQRSGEARGWLARESRRRKFARALCFQQRDFAARICEHGREWGRADEAEDGAEREPGKEAAREARRQRSRQAEKQGGKAHDWLGRIRIKLSREFCAVRTKILPPTSG